MTDQQDFIDKDEFQKNNIRQIEFAIKNLIDISRNWDNRIQELVEEITMLKNEIYIINKFPEKINENIKKLVPELADLLLYALKQKMLPDFENNLKRCNDQVNELGNKVEAISNKVIFYEQGEFKKKVINFGATIILSSMLTLGISYFVMQKFPKFIKIETKGNINIERSHVSVWEESEPKFKKNKHP